MRSAAPIPAAEWWAALPPPAFAAAAGAHASVRRYAGLAVETWQPALQEPLVCLHLGARKRIARRRDGRTETFDVGPGSLSVIPAGQGAHWSVEGEVDFALLLLRPAFVARIAEEEFGLAQVALRDAVGVESPEIAGLFHRLLPALEARGAAGRLYPDCLAVVLATALIADHAVRPPPAEAGLRKGGLGGWRLRRVLDHMAANLDRDVALSELTALAGLSRAQFFRAFRQSTGSSPQRHLAALRLERARSLLQESDLAIPEIAAAVGLSDPARFAAQFRARFAVAPNLFRAA